MINSLRLLTVTSFLVLAVSGGSYANVEERYAELKAVPEAINDPDPLMRLAKLEAIVAEGDTTKIQLALRTAFTVDDPNIQALALRAHFASFKTVIIEADFPEVSESGPDTERAYSETIEILQSVGLKFPFLVDYKELSQSEFSAISLNFNKDKERFKGTGNIRGNTLSVTADMGISTSISRQCTFELADYEGFTVKGTGSCANNYGTVLFPVQLRLF